MAETTLSHEEEAELQRALDAFNSGDFYAAHDHFEALWGEPFWKGLVQASVALHHFSVDNPAGFQGLPENVHRILDAYRPAYQGLDVEGFLQSFNAFFQLVARGGRPDVMEAPKLRRVDEAQRDSGHRHVGNV